MAIHHVFVAALAIMLFSRCEVDSVARAAPPLSAATFVVDVTPPIGPGPCVGAMPRIDRIEHPLQMRGLVLRSGDDTFVLAAIDYCGICNTSYETIREVMAQAAATTPARVSLQSLHQHTAPILDADAVALLYGPDSKELAQHRRFTNEIADRAAKALAGATARLQPISRIVGSRAKVDRVASNRRVPLADGSINVRASLTQDSSLRDAPEGLIDPWLRTLTFCNGARPVAQLHYYATHPQSFYGDARVSWDTVGIARDRMERDSGVFQVYFTGCGGNVALGKYNDGTPQAREEIAQRILDAMQRSSRAASVHFPRDESLARDDANGSSVEGEQRERVDVVVDVASLSQAPIAFDEAQIRFTVREDGAFDPSVLRSQLAAEQPFQTRLTAAMYAGFGERLREGYVARISRLRIGAIDVLHLPGEPFVEFQLFAQEQAREDAFVCVAGYGECGVWYYGPDSIYRDRGGYEQSWSLTGPCQRSVEESLTNLLRP